HLVSDHTTQDVVRAEIQAHLAGRGAELPPPPPFRDHVAQARLGVSPEEHRAFFTGMLGDVDEPTAPFGLLDVRGDGSGILEERLVVEARLGERLRERARALGVSAAAVCHVAWAQVLARVSGRDDVVFGTVLLGRMQGSEGAERTVGPFINTLPIRVRTGGVGVEAGVRRTHALLAELLRHEHASLALAQRCSAVEPSAPLFTSMLNYRHGGRSLRPDASPAAARPPVEGMRSLRVEERSNFPLTLAVDDMGDRFGLKAKVKAPLEPGRVCALMHRALEGVVEALETAPGRALGRIDVLPGSERARVLEEWNRTEADYPAGSCLHHLFEAQAARTPGAEALVFEGERLTYAALNARANRLAHHLRALGVGPDARVGICVERGVEMVVGLLALLKAGGAYVALDPDHPEARLRAMLDDSRPAVLLAQASLAGRFAGMEVPVLALDADSPPWAALPDTNPEGVGVGPEHLVYVIYTSGSTGTPKGVMNVHRNVVNRVAGIQARWRLEPGESVLQNASLSFDVSAYELFWPLMLGARVVMTRPDGYRDPAYLVETIRAHGVGTASFVPSMLQLFLEYPGVERCASLVRVPCGGEALPAALVRRLHQRLPGATLFNRYGPSEAATAVTGPVRVTDESHAIVPIGRPMPNVRVYLLDGDGEPVPAGVAGELYIGGAGVGRGYLGRPDQTAERFVADPFGAEPGARLYRTGDLARWLADGTLEFLGRTDFQMKVRGFRIEPGEIEARLKEHAGVREAVVVARDDALGGKRLVAYCVAGDGAEVESLRAHLGRALPDYMVPAAFVLLDRLPLTPNGKLDRAALPAPADEAFARRGYEAPADETEEALAAIWAEVLGLERVGRWDNFFALGGHSLLAVQVISRARQVLDVEVPLGRLFTRPVLADLAQEILDLQLAQVDPEEMARLVALLREPAAG
ncbi:MAG TPA: amino acid adenylation domain-containing protein, partial [Longimicrobium sp.]|nr:amino acid adenylation domain-containing protein [Longimicrobium sp.]